MQLEFSFFLNFFCYAVTVSKFSELFTYAVSFFLLELILHKYSVEGCWNIDGSRDLSDPWTAFTQFTLLEEKPPEGYMWSGGRLTRKQLTSRPDQPWPEHWKSKGKARQAEGEAKVV